MADELLFTVDGATAVPARRISLTEAGLLECQHLQQWVIDNRPKGVPQRSLMRCEESRAMHFSYPYGLA